LAALTNGAVAAINRYPVKSLGGHRVTDTRLGPLGIDDDRRWAIRDLDADKILSAKHPRLGPALLACPTDEVEGAMFVTVGDDRHPIGESEALDAALSAHLGIPVRLEPASAVPATYESEWPAVDGVTLSDVEVDLTTSLVTAPGTFVDGAALHLVTTSSLGHLAALLPDSTIHPARFRPSLVLEVGGEGFVENDWASRRLGIGEAVVEVTIATPRCVMTTRQQPGLDRDLDVLKGLARHNLLDLDLRTFACLGVYAEVVEPGAVSGGAPVAAID